MSNLIPISGNAQARTIDSRIVAEMVEKRHDHLVRDIENYSSTLSLSQNPTLGADQFFIESSYEAGTGRSYKCYLVTKKGCEMIANKMTGAKGIQFTAAYVIKFNDMERGQGAVTLSFDKESRRIRARALELNAKTRVFKALVAEAGGKNAGIIAYEVYGYKSLAAVTGQPIESPQESERLYSASEIGNEIGASANLIGRIAEANSLKTPDNGMHVMDKSRFSSKEVTAFRYNARGRQEVIRLVTEHLAQAKKHGKSKGGLN